MYTSRYKKRKAREALYVQLGILAGMALVVAAVAAIQWQRWIHVVNV